MSENSASKRLAKGTVVYMIGNMTSKVLQMLILPIITASLVTSEYGYYDLIVTTINLVTPMVTLQMIEGMFRYMFNSNEEDKKRTVSTVTAFLLMSCVALGIIIYTGAQVVGYIQYPTLIYLNYISSIVFTYMQKLARCQQKNQQFAISGVLNTIVMLFMQALTLLVFGMGVDGMLISNCVSYFAASGYLLVCLKIREWIDIQFIDKSVFRELFKYSAPLIPNSICWWLVSSSDRYVITFFMNTAANGIYSISGKFSQLLTFVTNVFQLAWQESAILEESNDTRDRFYTKIFNIYMKLLIGGYLFMLPFIRVVIPLLLNDSYQEGYLYNPILLLGAVFSAFSQFYGSAYMVFKKTSGAFSTTMIAAIINIVIGVGLINHIGLFAPALGTALSFLAQWVIRIHHLKDCFKVTIDKKMCAFLSMCVAVEIFVYYWGGLWMQIIALIIGGIIFVYINQDIIKQVVAKIFNR